jgi:hypothetical protein
MEAYRGNGGIVPRILDFGTRCEWSASRPPPFYSQGKSPCYPLDRRLGGPQSRSGSGGIEKNSQPLPGLEPPIIQPVAQRYTTVLCMWESNKINLKRNEIRRCGLDPSSRREGVYLVHLFSTRLDECIQRTRYVSSLKPRNDFSFML